MPTQPPATRWLFADQLGPAGLDGHDGAVLLVESRSVFRRRSVHRAKAHLILSALRHRAAELGDRATLLTTDTYREALAGVRGPVQVPHPTSRRAAALVGSLPGVEVVDYPGFATSREEFTRWADGRGRRRLLMEDFYRDTRRRLTVLMDGVDPVGGRWNFDADNREPPPKRATLGVAAPWWPAEDDIDAGVRRDLDRWSADGDVRFVGRDGPRRFAVTRAEALAALDSFVRTRLAAFGPHEDAMLGADWTMSHSLLSVPMNLGLLHPVEVARAAENAFRAGAAPLASVEGFIRQVLGWREYVWGLYWWLGEEYPTRNALNARAPLPSWFADLDAEAVQARCLRGVLADVRDYGWVHHIPRLMVLGSWALQRGYDPAAVSEWFQTRFVDGYEWVMAPNVIGMSQHADGGLMATKPYTSGGAYLHSMSDYCRGCVYRPGERVGARACPFTAGYWAFLDRTAAAFEGNHRMRQPLAGLRRLADRDAVVEQELRRGADAP